MDLHDFPKWAPFIGLMAQDQRARPFITKFLEGALPGVFVAASGLYISDKIQNRDIELLNKMVLQIQQDRRETTAKREAFEREMLIRMANIEGKLNGNQR